MAEASQDRPGACRPPCVRLPARELGDQKVIEDDGAFCFCPTVPTYPAGSRLPQALTWSGVACRPSWKGRLPGTCHGHTQDAAGPTDPAAQHRQQQCLAVPRGWA